jgi:hypothetical protein
MQLRVVDLERLVGVQRLVGFVGLRTQRRRDTLAPACPRRR